MRARTMLQLNWTKEIRNGVPWKVLEKQGWITQALCTEVRVSLPPEERYRYAIAEETREVSYRIDEPDEDRCVRTLGEKAQK